MTKCESDDVISRLLVLAGTIMEDQSSPLIMVGPLAERSALLAQTAGDLMAISACVTTLIRRSSN